MSDQTPNPFVLPGMGQGSADTAGNPLIASMEMMRQAWAGLTGPGGLAQALPMTPPMNLQELERRIAELRTVESWLRMNLSMLSSTIQGLEVQRSTIATLRSFVDGLGAQRQGSNDWGDASPLEIVLGLKPAPRSAGAPAAGSPEADAGAPGARRDAPAREPAGGASAPEAAQAPGDAGAAAGSPSAGSAQAISHAAQSASEAWWGMLQQQFNQLAAATAATMPAGGPAGKPAADAPGTDPGREAAGGRKAAAASAGAGAGAAGQGGAATNKAAPRKTAVRKNKIQSKPDQS